MRRTRGVGWPIPNVRLWETGAFLKGANVVLFQKGQLRIVRCQDRDPKIGDCLEVLGRRGEKAATNYIMLFLAGY